jgi:lipoprotein NlpD
MLPPSSSPAAARSFRTLRTLAAAALVALVAACATRTPAPVVERPAKPAPAPVVVSPSRAPAPPAAAPEADWRPKTYTVKKGDTLHQIALDYGLDYRELAGWNNVENPNVIRVGQVLRLTPPGEPASAAAAPGVTVTPLRTVPPVVAGEARAAPAPATVGPRNSDTYKTQPKVVKEPYSEQALRDVQRMAASLVPSAEAAPAAGAAPTAPAPPAPPSPAGAATASGTAAAAAGSAATPAASGAAAAPPTVVARADTKLEAKSDAAPSAATGEDGRDKLNWMWPATGKIVTGFTDSANLKGIDIAGKAGEPVVASAAGKVVYAGSGLRGYGKLVIVKHNDTYLSAYAHNSDILVKEGQQVARGQKIAEMGNTDSDSVKLHFEIRRLGKPVDPLKYLPPV